MATIRFVLEFEIVKSPVTLATLPDFWGEAETPAERAEFAAALPNEQLLAQVVDADPELNRQIILNQVLGNFSHFFDSLDVRGITVPELLSHGHKAVLGPMVEALPAEVRESVRAYCQEAGLFEPRSSFGPLAEERISLPLSRVFVEDERGVLVSSDDSRLKRSRKKSRR